MYKIVEDNKKSDDDNSLVVSLVYHPDSQKLENRIREIVNDELKKFGLTQEDAHEKYNDLNWVRKQRIAKENNSKDITSIVVKWFVTGILGLITLGVIHFFGTESRK